MQGMLDVLTLMQKEADVLQFMHLFSEHHECKVNTDASLQKGRHVYLALSDAVESRVNKST